MSNKFVLKRRWKPPFPGLPFAVIISAILLLLCHETQADSSSELDPDSIKIQVDKSPFSLTYSVLDAESFEIQNVTCKSKTNLEIVGNANHTCENLDPCSNYLIVLTVKKLLEETQPVVDVIRDDTTDYHEPEVLIVGIEPSTESINMSWKTTSQTCISTFQIEANSADKAYKWTMTNDATNLTMDGLSPCQEYNITLKTYDVNNNIISNRTSKSQTEYEEPGDVTMTISEHERGQLKVSWELLSHTTCVKYFYLKWTLLDCQPDNIDSSPEHNSTDASEGQNNGAECGGSKNMTGSVTKEHIITNLQGCDDYEVQFFVNNLETIKAEQIIKSPEQVPGPVTIQSTDIRSTTATLNWNTPQQHRKCVHHYFVQISGPEERPNEQQSINDTECEETTTEFTDLDPCGKYNYTIVPQSLNGTRGDGFTSDFKTQEGIPSAVRNYAVLPEPFALNLSWDPPSKAELCLASYRVIAWDDEGTQAFETTTTNTSVFVNGLKACVGYTVQIVPITALMNDGELLQIESETSPKAPSAPTTTLVGTYPDRLAISAQESDKNNKCETIFARIVCTARTDAPYKVVEKYVKGQLGILFNTEVGPLSPFTEYACDTALYNIGGWSPVRTISKSTTAYYPNKPENVNVKSRTNNSLTFSWKSPKYPNGVIKLYITYFQRVEAAYFVPSKCSVITSDLKLRETSSLEQPFEDLLPYTRYSVQVAAQNEFGLSESTAPAMEITQPWVSEPVTNLNTDARGPSETSLEYEAYVVISWNSPCKSNGEIEYFVLEFQGVRADKDPIQFLREIEPDFSNDGNIVYNETALKPEYNYNVSVSVKTRNVAALSRQAVKHFEAPAGIPQIVDPSLIDRARVEAYEGSNPSKTAIVRFPYSILESEYGTINFVALLLSQKNCNPDPQPKFGAMDTINRWPEIKSWNEVYEDRNTDCIQQYQTTPRRWVPVTTSARTPENIEFVIGTDDCVGSSGRYCNGPLKPDTEYFLVIRLFTKSGYNDTAVLTFKTDALIELTIILAGVSSCLLLAFIAGFVYLWVTKRIKWQRESLHGIEDSFGDIGSKKFAMYYRELSKPEKIAREFKELTAVALDLSYSASEMGYNKNRYADIFPYDKNRVILDIDADGSDYINASFIDGYRRRKEYIATQGPKPESTTDFWRMVLQHNIRVIVMVTQFREGDVIKCHEYFPFQSKGINVNQKKKESFDLYDRTELSVVHEMFGLKQKVVHFYFKKWPDHGCPSDPMHVISFLRKVKAEKIPSYSPIVVHCSAGVGRTGTFIGLDIIMQRLKNESKINIYETVKKLRFQRMKMVQTPAQYTFLYSCAFELVKHKLKSSDLKPGNGKKQVSFDADAENNVQNRQRPRNGSDMSSFSDHRQNSVDQSNDAFRAAVPITFSGISNGAAGASNESAM